MKITARIVYAMGSPKVKMINLRLSPETHEAFKIACELRGGSMSSLLHQFVVRTIREERDLDPGAFKPKVSGRPLATSGQKIPLGNSQLPKKKTGT